MTTIANAVVTCSVCGAENRVAVLQSTSSFGAPDLDFRPQQPARSSLFAYVQRCGDCGYCSHDLEEDGELHRKDVRRADYKQQLLDPALPELANSFLCAALLETEFEEEVEAARFALCATWACDDAGLEGAARRCRLLAVDYIRAAQGDGDEFHPDIATEGAIVVYLLRRAGRFEDVIAEAHKMVEYAEDEQTRAVLEFGRERAAAGDDRRYTFADVFERGATDAEIVDALKTLVAYGHAGDYYGKVVVLRADDERNYYVQFAVDRGGLFCEVVHNKYLAPEDAFTGDDIAPLLAMGFEGPTHEDQNLVRVFSPTLDEDYAAIVSVVRAVVTDYFGLPVDHLLDLSASD